MSAMTDGERLVWAASYAIAIDHGADAVVATMRAARAIEQLREEATRRPFDHKLSANARDFLDDIASVP